MILQSIFSGWMTIYIQWRQLLSFKSIYKASCFIMHHQKEDTGVTCLFIYGIEIKNETKNRLVFLWTLRIKFWKFFNYSYFQICCFIFPLLNELFEGKQSNDFTFKFKSKCTSLHRRVTFLYNLSVGYFAVIGIINSSYIIL